MVRDISLLGLGRLPDGLFWVGGTVLYRTALLSSWGSHTVNPALGASSLAFSTPGLHLGPGQQHELGLELHEFHEHLHDHEHHDH